MWIWTAFIWLWIGSSSGLFINMVINHHAYLVWL
jgi:hypothetical protein